VVVKLSGREADHSHPSNAEVRNAWSCASTSPWRASQLKHRGHLYLYLIPFGSKTLNKKLWKRRRIWEDSIRMHHREIGRDWLRIGTSGWLL
jgi:hypothetical protein